MLWLVIIGIIVYKIVKFERRTNTVESCEKKEPEDLYAEFIRIKEETQWQEAELIRIAKEQERLEKEQIRQAKELEKHNKRISDLEFKKKQAEADIITEQEKLDQYTAKLSALDEKVKKLERDIEFYQLANKVDAENKARVEIEKVNDKIFTLEDKVRGCEKRLSKAQHIKESAAKELAA